MGWPQLREELALYPGPQLYDGQPSWTLHDPVRNQFFRLDWLTFEILRLWSKCDANAIIAEISETTTLQPDLSDIEMVFRFLSESQLVVPEPSGSSARMAESHRKKQGKFLNWLLHHYLFFRVPLVRPDRWLSRQVHRVEVFYTRSFRVLTVLALLFGVVGIFREWGKFSATLVDHLSIEGLLGYGVTLTLVKVLHELGHAFTAKRYGCRIPAMGVAFLVMWPVAYTDTNEVWKLPKRGERLADAAAGIVTELTIAAWAAFLWALLPEGLPKSIAFMLTTTVWIASLAINSSPFMRFDGYFLLSDWLDTPNLHARSFALARWDLRERLFKLNEPIPEVFPARRTRLLILFAWATWIYRLVLFLGIATLVYHFFIKAVGILLFIVEIGWFVLLPFWSEFKEWKMRWPALRNNRRAWRSAIYAALFLMIFILPWPTRVSSSGILKPAEIFPIYAPAGAQIAQQPPANGARMEQGATVFQLASAEMQKRWQIANAKIEASSWQADVAGVDSEQKHNLLVLQEIRASAEAELASVQADLELYAPKAPFAGRVVDVDPDLRLGTWVSRNEKLGALVKDDRWMVETYLDEESVRRVKEGNLARFISDGREGSFLRLVVTSVDRDATRALPDAQLATQFGGSILTREKNGQHIPERATYRVVLEVTDPIGVLQGKSWRGHVAIDGAWEAPGARFIRAAINVIMREAGF